MNDQELMSFWKDVFLIYYKNALENDQHSHGAEFAAALKANEALKELKARMEKTDIFVLKPKNDCVIGSPA